MEIIDHKPKLIRRSFIGSLNRKIKEFLQINFKKISQSFNLKTYIISPNSV